MKTLVRTFAAASALAATLAFAATASAQSPTTTTPLGTTVLDSGRFVTFSGGVPVATEDFSFEQRHDTLFVTSNVTRHARAEDGTVKPYQKAMQLMVNVNDLGLLLYASTEKFDGHRVNRMVMPAESTVTVTVEKDQYGTADAIVRPPGRVNIVDAGMFTLFDVICRNLSGRLFSARPVGVITLGDQNIASEATATPAGRDTIRWGAKRVVADHITFADSTVSFSLWTGPGGKLLRLENSNVDLVVMREPPAVPSPNKRPRPRPRP